MLRLLSAKAQERKKSSKPCHIGIHWKAVVEYYQIGTHIPGFRSFSAFFASFCFNKISYWLSSQKVYVECPREKMKTSLPEPADLLFGQYK